MKTLTKYFIVSLIILISCKGNSEKSEWIDYKSEDGSISFNYPENWSIDVSKSSGANIYLFSGNTENINLIIQDIGNDYNLDSYTQLSENQIRSIEGSKLYQSERIQINGNEVHFLEYQADIRKRRELRFMQYCILKHQKAYVITYTCELDRFEKTKHLALKIMQSFKIQ